MLRQFVAMSSVTEENTLVSIWLKLFHSAEHDKAHRHRSESREAYLVAL